MGKLVIKPWMYVASASVAVVLAAVLILFSGTGKDVPSESGSAGRETVARGFELLNFIPTDACGIIFCRKLGAGMEKVLDRDNVFRQLPLSAFAGGRMVVSYHWLGSLVPMLAFEAGRPDNKTMEKVWSLRDEAVSSGLSFRQYQTSAGGRKRVVVLLCANDNILSEADRTIAEQVSLLDVKNLEDALSVAPSKGDVIIFRNSDIAKLDGADLFRGYVPRKLFNDFIGNYSEWSIMSLLSTEEAGRGEYQKFSLNTVQGDDYRYFANALSGLGFGESKVASILPYMSTYVLDMPLCDVSAFINARKNNLDARGRLAAYEKRCAELKSEYGVHPETWAEELKIMELAKVWSKGEEILLVRPDKAPAAHSAIVNPTPGYIAAVFGAGFSAASDEYCVCMGKWLVYGSLQAVNHFVWQERKLRTHDWPGDGTKLAVLADDIQLTWTKRDGMVLDYYRKY